MADIYVKAPDGSVVVIDDSEQQRAVNSGYQMLSPEELQAAQNADVSNQGEAGAVASGALQAPAGGYDPTQEFLAKATSAATFGLAGLNDPQSVATAQRFQEERPGLAFAAEAVGQLPLAVAAGGLGEAAVAAGRAAGLGRGALGAVRGADFAAQAAIGGAQTEAEQTRLAQDEFSFTDAAITGVVGEALGRGAAYTLAKGVGGARNLVARAARDVVAEDAAESLAKGGWLNDYRVAQHAEAYHNELAELAARDLDELETSFAEVSRQDRKRGRITRVVADDPAVQAPVRAEAAQSLAQLRDALSDELADAGGPARKLLKQLDERIAKLEEAPTGKRLWRVLDENRQALQEYRQDLHQAYESNPGSAWLSREGLAAIDAAEKATREALLREDVWGEAAARMQREYNTPFHEKYFPTVKTVRNDLMFAPHENAEGFKVFQGDPAKVKRFLARDVASPDGHRLGEQFRSYLDGVEAIARAGQSDTPQAAHRVLEAVRRLRKAQANAQFVSAAAERAGKRAAAGEVVADVAAGAAGAATFGVPGAVGFAGASRGLRIGHWLSKAASKLGLGSGEALSMAKLLERDALPAPSAADRPFVDDLAEAEVPRGPTSTPPSRGPSSTPPDDGGGGGEPLDVGIFSDAPPARPTAPDLGTPTPLPESGVSLRPGRESRAAMPTRPVEAGPEVHRGQQERLELEPLRDARGASKREARRLEALADGEFRDVVRSLRASGEPEARELADALETRAPELKRAGLVSEAPPRGIPTGRASESLSPDAEALRDLLAEVPGKSAAELRAQLGMDDSEFGRAFMELRSGGLAEVRDGGAYLKLAAESPEAAATAQVFRDIGLETRMGADRLGETLDHVFGPGKAPTPEQWRQIIPLETLAKLGPVEKARIDVLGDAFIWSAEGKQGIMGPHRTWDGLESPGGQSDNAWTISRTFQRDDAGKLDVHHDHFMVRPDLQGTGVGAEVLKSMMDAYRKMGVDSVSVDAVEVGKYFWPSIGFNHPDPGMVKKAVDEYAKWLVGQKGLSTLQAEAAAKGIRSLPNLAQAEYGKEFLLAETGPWNWGMKMELKDENPLYHLMRGRLDIAAAAIAGLGGALEGARKEGGENEPAPAGAAAAGGLFAARAGLFKAARGKLVAEVAKRLFSSTAEPAAKVAARLVYSRTQLKARQEEFQEWAENPQALVERVAEGFRDVPPEHSGTVASGVFRAAAFLKQRLPTVAKLNAISLRQIPVSQDAMLKFARYEQAALRPREAWQNAAAGGHVSAELLETTEELYPDLLAELRVGAIQTVTENGPPTTVQGRLAYARLFDGRGELADPAFSQTVANMTAYAYEQAVPTQPGGGPTSSGNVSHVAAASAPPAGVGAARLT